MLLEIFWRRKNNEGEGRHRGWGVLIRHHWGKNRIPVE
jgi:hypothetical protein